MRPPRPQLLPAAPAPAPAPAHPVATLPPTASSAEEALQLSAPTSSDMPSPSEEATTGQPGAAFSDSAAVSGSQEATQAAVRRKQMHHQQTIARSEDGDDMVPGTSGFHASYQADVHPGRSAQPHALPTVQPSASSDADVTCEIGREGSSPEGALAEGSKLGAMQSSEPGHGMLLESEEGSEGGNRQQVAQSTAVFNHREDQPDVPSSSWKDLQAGSCPQAAAQSSTQAGPSTEADAQAEAVNQGELPNPAYLFSDGASRASPTEMQSSVASGAGQRPSPGAQAVPLGDAREAAATAEGLAANTQLHDSNELTGQLLTVAALLMLTLLFFMTGLLTLPCIVGKPILRSSLSFPPPANKRQPAHHRAAAAQVMLSNPAGAICSTSLHHRGDNLIPPPPPQKR